MAHVRVSVYKDKQGKAVVVLNKDGKIVKLDINDCCTIGDSVDSFLFKKPMKVRIPNREQDNPIQPMEKEEMHDLLYNTQYEDGTDFTKAMSIKLVNLIDIDTIKTFGGLLLHYNILLKENKRVLKF